MSGPLALCLALHVLGVTPQRADRPSLAPRLSLGPVGEATAPEPALPLGPPLERRGSFAAGWATSAGATLAGDVLAASALLLLVRPGEWTLQRWAVSFWSANGGGSVFPFLVLTGLALGAAVVWGTVPPAFALAGARRGAGVVPSPSTRTLTVLAHLAVSAVAIGVAVRRSPEAGCAVLAAGDLLVVPALAAGLTARDAAGPAARARPERDPALALAR